MPKVPLDESVDLVTLARGTPGFSGADLANLVNEAALFAGRRNKKKVDQSDFEDAKDKIYMGPERRSMVMHEDENAPPPTTKQVMRLWRKVCRLPTLFTRLRLCRVDVRWA